MNDTVIARPCWSMLAQRAQDELDRIALESTQTRMRLTKLQASLDRLEKMYDDYCKQVNQPGMVTQGMREAMSQRQFMSQLLTLMQRVKTDVHHTHNQLEAYKERLVLLERERLKMQSLAEKNADDLLKQANQKEQRRMDEIAVMQFNRRLAS